MWSRFGCFALTAGQTADISAARWMCKTPPELKAGQFVGVCVGGSHALNSTTVAGFRANQPAVGDEDAFIKVLPGVVLSDQWTVAESLLSRSLTGRNERSNEEPLQAAFCQETLMRHLLGGHGNKSHCWTTVGATRETGGDVNRRRMGPFPEALQRGGGAMDQRVNKWKGIVSSSACAMFGVCVSWKHSDDLTH